MVRFLLGSSAPAPLWRMATLLHGAKARQLDELECHDGLAVMSAPQYDARDVLDKYVATLNKPSNGNVRDTESP